MMTTSNGIKAGLIGLGEREWLATINSLPPNLIYKSASEVAKELVPKLREEGAEIIICLSHMREPNDNKLADQTDGIIDIILGGHDHYYAHSFRKGTHVLRSGTDFKQLSYIEAWRKKDDPKRWDFDIWRRDITSEVPEDEQTAKLVNELTSKLQKSLSKPIGWTATPLDARFLTARLKESNMGNFVCDIMRMYHHADCGIMAGGTIRGDQIYPPGAIRIKDITTCFPFEDPVVLLRATGQAIWDALENGVSMYPALEGRFPQVSNIVFEFDPRRESGKRVLSLEIGGERYEPERKYLLATRGYMGRGKGECLLNISLPPLMMLLFANQKHVQTGRWIHKFTSRVRRRPSRRDCRRRKRHPHLHHATPILHGPPHRRPMAKPTSSLGQPRLKFTAHKSPRRSHLPHRSERAEPAAAA